MNLPQLQTRCTEADLTPAVSMRGLKTYVWDHECAHSILTTINVAPLEFVNVSVAIDRPRGLHAALITQLDAGHVYFINITGIGPVMEGPGEDIGTYMVNCAIQAIVPLYFKPREIMLFGMVSPEAGGIAGADGPERAVSKGVRFWKKFGFSFRIFENDFSVQLSGVLSDLHTVQNGRVAGEFPTLVPFKKFTRVS
jgi:hypothetical protein